MRDQDPKEAESDWERTTLDIGLEAPLLHVWVQTRTWTCVLVHTHAYKHTPLPFTFPTNADQQRSVGQTSEYVNKVLLEQGHIFIFPFLYPNSSIPVPLSPPNFLCSLNKIKQNKMPKNKTHRAHLWLPVCTWVTGAWIAFQGPHPRRIPTLFPPAATNCQ